VNETEGSSRKSEDITRIRVVWQEDDNNWEGEFPLPPSMVVASSPGRYHRYWLVEGEWPADDDGRRDFNSVMAGMVENHGSDPNAKDIARVLRLPGTLHRKTEEAHPCRLVDALGRRYTREQLVDAFGISLDSEPTSGSPSAATEGLWERLLEALPHIPSNDRDIWARVGMAIHHESGGSREGYALWANWSRNSIKYEEREQFRQWRSFKPHHGNPVTAASIFGLAIEHGWTGGESLPPPLTSDRPQGKVYAGGEFTRRVIEATKAQFDDYQHYPSDDHWKGLGTIAAVFEQMAFGKAPSTENLAQRVKGLIEDLKAHGLIGT